MRNSNKRNAHSTPSSDPLSDPVDQVLDVVLQRMHAELHCHPGPRTTWEELEARLRMVSKVTLRRRLAQYASLLLALIRRKRPHRGD